jgi:hypothetical protein
LFYRTVAQPGATDLSLFIISAGQVSCYKSINEEPEEVKGPDKMRMGKANSCNMGSIPAGKEITTS